MNTLIPILKKLAQTSDFKYKLAAAILDDRGNVISTGVNIRKTHPLQAKYAKKCNQEDKQYLHAELSALVRCRSKPSTIIVLRTRSNGSLGTSSPCQICRLAIKEAGIRTIIYSNNKGEFVEESV